MVGSSQTCRPDTGHPFDARATRSFQLAETATAAANDEPSGVTNVSSGHSRSPQFGRLASRDGADQTLRIPGLSIRRVALYELASSFKARENAALLCEATRYLNDVRCSST